MDTQTWEVILSQANFSSEANLAAASLYIKATNPPATARAAGFGDAERSFSQTAKQ
jgi:hypothetical protein